MIRWMILSTLAAGLFYGLYCLLLRRDRWLQLSRIYLLLALAFSLGFPFIPMPQPLLSQPMAAPAEMLTLTLDGIEVTADDTTATRLADTLPTLYLFVLTLTLAVLLFQLGFQAVRVWMLRRKHTVYSSTDGFQIPQGASLVLVPDNTAPYSFFNQIVVGTRDLSDNELRCILAHESLHVQRCHTLDLLLARLICCVAWFNPFAWLICRELGAVHEFQADAASLDACSREDYLRLLYRQATGTGYGHITNNFQSINIKNRIMMMKQTQTRYGAWKVAVALPVVALLLMVGCKPAPAVTADAEEPAVTEATVEPELFDMENAPEGFQPPEYPGGMEAFYEYLSKNIQYPEQAKADGIQGRVLVRFVVMNDGSIVNVEVARGIGGGCDEEAVRVVKEMPHWKPAISEGKAVNVNYALPITFKLQ